MKNDTNKQITLRERVTSEMNIFNAIHAIRSYVFEETLLNKKDQLLYSSLLDEFNLTCVNNTIRACRKRLNDILSDPDCFFKVKVYFRIKNQDENTNEIKFRPIHTASLIDQICMACMLQCLMFEDDEQRKPSDLSKKIPHNFFGNRPSTSVDRIFEQWQEKYTEYNQKIVDTSKRYRQSHEYKTEVTLDIKNFFPSIDPRFVIDYCTETLSGRYGHSQEDMITLQLMLEKLVYLQIDEANIKEWEKVYYGEYKKDTPIFMARGVAQGLPQSYFFGNICMVEIRNILKKPEILEGEALYYVDDSVIYIKNNFIDTPFIKKIKDINSELKTHINSFIKSPREDRSSAIAKKFHEKINYNIEFHSDKKSSYCHIDDTEWNLHGLPRIVSELGLIMLLDEIDQNIQIDKLEALNTYVENYLSILKISKIINGERTESTEKEINALCDKIKADGDIDLNTLKEIFKKIKKKQLNADNLKADEKLLKRYRKLFLYNVKTLKFKQEGEITKKQLDSFNQEFEIKGQPSEQELRNWLENDDVSRFRAEGRMLIRNLPLKDAKRVYDDACKWERYVSSTNGESTEWLYHRKDFSGILRQKSITTDVYGSLKNLMKLHYTQLRQTTLENRIHHLTQLILDLEYISKGSSSEKGNRNSHPIYDIINDSMSYALRNSEEMKRRILNAFFSFISEYDISDTLMLAKTAGKPIPYSELRILAMLRNKQFTLQDFKQFITTIECNSLENRMAIDYGLTKILGEVVRYVSKPIWVDCLIQTHRITKGLWQNGSKFLNSYTLHNEEHAMTLIEKSIDIVKKINYLQLKQADYFILFTACYLHDISMVIHPNLMNINDGSEEARKLISKWLFKIKESKDFYESKKDETKQKYTNTFKETGIFLKEIFDDFYKHFEEKTRSLHAKESARFVIEKHKDLFNYLDPIMTSAIAHVGESHGYDIRDVYGLKSEARHDSISLKYIMMVIRLADLHDVANDRINYHLLRQNVEHMDEDSRFHWISHLITDSIRLIPDYSVYFKVIDNEDKFDIQQYIIETLKFELHINVKCLSPIPQQNGFCKCTGVSDIKMTSSDETNAGYFSVKIGTGACTNDKCPTICRWIMKKHKWMVKELEALNAYLNSLNQGMIRSRIELNIIFKDELDLEQDLYDDVMKYLESH